MKTPVLETERLVLRPLTVEDAELIYRDWGREKRNPSVEVHRRFLFPCIFLKHYFNHIFHRIKSA